MTSTVSVVYVNYHCEHLIERSIQALVSSPGQFDLEILVVDNGSSLDASFWSRLPVQHLPSVGNVGFGIACNRGASHSSGEYLLFLNPDTIPDPGLVESLQKHMASHPETSVCGPALTDADGRPQVYWNFHHLLSWELAESLYLQGLWRKIYQRRMIHRFGIGQPWPSPFVSGACLFLRREIFDKVGGFDPRFFLNYEDYELCRRLSRHGALHFLPFLRLVHEEGATQRANWGNYVFQRLVAHRTYIDIAYDGWRWLAARAILVQTISLRLVIGVVLLRAEGRTRLPGYWKALGSAFRPRTN